VRYLKPILVITCRTSNWNEPLCKTPSKAIFSKDRRQIIEKIPLVNEDKKKKARGKSVIQSIKNK
jgi:hypothetical protein